MVRSRSLAAFGFILALSLPGGLRAQDKPCDYQADIVTLSDYVLKNRAGLPRFKSLRYGAISAYLKIRYAKPQPRDIEALLMPMVQARVARADEVLFAWAINTYGVDAATAIMGPKTTGLLLGQGYGASVLHAAIVKEGLSALTDQIGNATEEESFQVQNRVAPALLDRFDTFKGELAREAEAKGLMQIAAGLAATQSDPKAWQEFAARQANNPALARALSYWYWAPALVGQPALPRPGLDPAYEANRTALHAVMIASAKMPERDFLSTYVNYNGRVDEARKAGETILTLAADTSGEAWTMDRAWIAAYLDLLANSDDPQAVDSTLKAISFGGLRHYDGTVRDVLDWMIAADALKPYLAGTSEDLSPPGLLSADFAANWPAWREVAAAIRSGGDLQGLAATPERMGIAAELLFASGRNNALAGFLTRADPSDTSVKLAEDFANRMDRTCYGYLTFPAESIVFPDTPMFRFD